MGTDTFSHDHYSTSGAGNAGESDPVRNILSSLKNVKRSGSGWTARCPAHDDQHNSLCVGYGRDGRALIDCKVGCEPERIVAALNLKMSDLFAGKQSKKRARRSIPADEPSTVQQSDEYSSCTLAAYAAEKQLPEAFLRSLGLSDFRYAGRDAVRMPYLNGEGLQAAVRYRTALKKSEASDNRFKWKAGSKLCLYGLWKIESAQKAGHVVLCEGESDVHTLWYHDIPALGVPGADTWREEWAEHLEGISTIYVVIEPDKGGEAVRRWLDKSRIRERVQLLDLRTAKDPSGLYLQAPNAFRDQWKKAINASTAWTSVEQAEAQARMQQAWSLCQDLAQERDILGKFSDALVARGVAGETRAAKLVYLGVTSRFLHRPVSMALKGPSSAGKSFTVEQTLSFFPASAYYALSAMSERALAYSQEPLKHRILVIYEAIGVSGDFASYLVRSLLSEGKVRYETVEKSAKGLQPRLMEREGPTGLIVTTTAISLHPENETRMLSIPVADSQEQTRRVLLALADESRVERTATPAEWLALQEWLECAEHSVTIPYGRKLAESMPAVAVRLRRDFNTLLNLIRAHAILHQMTRHRNDQGKIVASLADYAAVRALVVDLISEGVEATVSNTVRDTVEAVRALCGQTDITISIAQLAAHLKLDKAAVSRRVKSCLAGGYLRNLETSKGRPAKLVIGDDLPEDRQILPLPEQLGSEQEAQEYEAPDAQEQEGECCTVDGETAENDTSAPVSDTETGARRDGWTAVPPGSILGAGVYRFDQRTGRTYRKAAVN